MINRTANLATLIENEATVLRAEVKETDGKVYGCNGRLTDADLYNLKLSGRAILGKFLIDMGRKLIADSPEGPDQTSDETVDAEFDIDNATKAELVNYAKYTFGVRLNQKKNRNELKAKVRELIDKGAQ